MCVVAGGFISLKCRKGMSDIVKNCSYWAVLMFDHSLNIAVGLVNSGLLRNCFFTYDIWCLDKKNGIIAGFEMDDEKCKFEMRFNVGIDVDVLTRISENKKTF